MLLNKKESIALDSLRFLCIITLLLHHSVIDHLVDNTELASILRNTHQLIAPPFLCILFFLSGYLFFYTKKDCQIAESLTSWGTSFYLSKIKKRIYSLIIPYIIWCFVSFLYQSLVKHKEFGINSPWDAVMLLWDTGSGHPIGMALWYIRNLIVFTLLSPLYFLTIKYLRHFTLLLILALQDIEIPIDYPFFNMYLLLGSYLSLMDISIEKVVKVFNWQLCLVLYVICKISMFCFDNISIDKLVVFTLCVTGFIGLFMKRSIPAKYTVASTMIYFLHPYLTGVRNILIKYADTSSLLQDILIWILTALTVLTICISTFFVMKRLSPKVLSVMTGGRI